MKNCEHEWLKLRDIKRKPPGYEDTAKRLSEEQKQEYLEKNPDADFSNGFVFSMPPFEWQEGIEAICLKCNKKIDIY